MAYTTNTALQPINETYSLANNAGMDTGSVNLTRYETGAFNFSVQIYSPDNFFADDGIGGFQDIDSIFKDFKKAVLDSFKAYKAANPPAQQGPVIAPSSNANSEAPASSSSAVASSMSPSSNGNIGNGQLKNSTVASSAGSTVATSSATTPTA